MQQQDPIHLWHLEVRKEKPEVDQWGPKREGRSQRGRSQKARRFHSWHWHGASGCIDANHACTEKKMRGRHPERGPKKVLVCGVRRRGGTAIEVRREHKGGARNDWWRYRQTYSKEWRENADTRLKEGYAKIHDMCRNIEAKGEEGWEDLKAESPEGKRQILQALNVDGQLGGKLRQKMERLVRESLRQHKEAKKKPNGDFVKLLITHTGWNATDIRGIIREPGVCKVHPDPTAAERIWVCERNVPPIGSWLLNYTAMEDEELDAKTREAVENWEEEEGEKEPQAQKRDNCGCFTTVINPEKQMSGRGTSARQK